MGFLDSLGDISGFAPVVGGISSIVGLLQDGSARQRALQQQQQALQAYGSAADQQYQNMLGNNSRTLMGTAGQGATALTNMGSNLGAANAAAGLYNNSAVGGSLALGQQGTQTALANLSAQQNYNANSIHNQALQALAQMQLGQANTNYGYANQDLQGSRQGFGNFLGALGQSNLLGQGGGGYNGDYSYAQGQINQVPAAEMGLGGSGGGGGTGLGGMYDGSSMMQSMPAPGSYAGVQQAGQYNLAALGGNPSRLALPQMNGTISQAANLPGMAGGLGNGGQGTQGTNPFYPQRPRYGWGQQQPMGGPLGGR